MNDDRFSFAKRDARFKKIKKSNKKVVLDKRFESLLSDEFKTSYTKDEFGRSVTTDVGNDLNEFYSLENTKNEPSETQKNVKNGRYKKQNHIEENDEDGNSTDEELQQYLKERQTIAEKEAEQSEEEKEDIPLGDPTNRFAVINIDWSEIRATDLFASLNSFTPTEGVVRSVTVYMSDFGKKRLEEEALNGPPQWIWAKEGAINENESEKEKNEDKQIDSEELEEVEESNSSEEEEEEFEEENEVFEEGEEVVEEEDEKNKGKLTLEQEYDPAEGFDPEALRKYELEKMKYYYAIVECDSVETAVAIVQNCDGIELEKSANHLDLRFVPNEENFTNPIRDKCTELPPTYNPLSFYTKSKQDTHIRLTWDENPSERQRVLNRDTSKLTDAQIDEYGQFIDGNEDENESEESESEIEEPDENGCFVGFALPKTRTKLSNQQEREKKKERLRTNRERIKKQFAALLNEDNEEKGTIDKEITFESGAIEKGEELTRKIDEEKENATSSMWELYQKRRKERMKLKKAAKRENKMGNGEDEESDENENEESDDKKKKTKDKTKKKNLAIEQKKKAELELLMIGENEETALKPKEEQKSTMNKRKGSWRARLKAKRAQREEETAAAERIVKTDDHRFDELFSSNTFAPDPTIPEFKKAEGINAILKEREKRTKNKQNEHIANSIAPKRKQNDDESLVKSLKKRKTKRAQ